MDEIKYQNNNEVLRKFPNLSKSVDERGKFQSGSESLFKNDYPNFMRKYENYEKQEDINTKINENMGNLLHSSDKFIQSHIRKSPDKINEIKGINSNFINKNKKDEVNELFSHNEKNKEDLDALLRSSDRFNQSFRTKSPHRMNEVKGRNYNYVNKNKKDEVKALLFIDKTYNKPVERVYEDIDNPLKINKKDYIEMISNPKVSIYNLNKNKNDISNYEILKKKFVNYIHFNIHKESIDDKIIEKANKIRECEEKKFLMSKIINDIKLREKYNSALEKRIIASFDEVCIFILINNLKSNF